MRVLALAAHPDDETLGAGGTLALHARRGDEVTIAILGTGATARRPRPGDTAAAELAELRAAAVRAATILGVADVRHLDLPDNRFDGVVLLEVVKLVEGLVEATRPEVVYTHFSGDLNVDHEVTARATLTACRPLPGSPVRRLLAYEVPSATGWGDAARPFLPTVFVDVSATLEAKLAATGAYASEVRDFPHPRSAEALRARAAAWGSQAGVAAAEAFVLLREIG